MVNQNIVYDEKVKNESTKLLKILSGRAYDCFVRLGDVYGPERTAISVQVNISSRYVLCEYNSYFWRIGFFKESDVEGSQGISFRTKFSSTEEFIPWLIDFFENVV